MLRNLNTGKSLSREVKKMNSDNSQMNSPHFLSTKRRLTRSEYFLYLLAFSAIQYLAIVIAVDRHAEGPAVIFSLVLAALMMLPTIQRFHDLDRSGLWAFTTLIPVVNIVPGIYLLFFRGTIGPNRFGRDPLNSNVREIKTEPRETHQIEKTKNLSGSRIEPKVVTELDSESIEARLIKLRQLRDNGLISDTVYKRKEQEILEGL